MAFGQIDAAARVPMCAARITAKIDFEAPWLSIDMKRPLTEVKGNR